MIVLLEYIDIFYKQSTVNIWVGLDPCRPTLGYVIILNDVDIFIITVYELQVNSCRWCVSLLHVL